MKLSAVNGLGSEQTTHTKVSADTATAAAATTTTTTFLQLFQVMPSLLKVLQRVGWCLMALSKQAGRVKTMVKCKQ